MLVTVIFVKYLVFGVLLKSCGFSNWRREFLVAEESMKIVSFQLNVYFLRLIFPPIFVVQPLMYLIIFKAYKLMLQRFSIKGNENAADESTAVFIYFIGWFTNIIYVVYMTRLAIFPYRRETYTFGGVKYNCGPYRETDTIESEFKKFIHRSSIAENFVHLLQNYIFQILAFYSFVALFNFGRTVNSLRTQKMKDIVEENQSSINIQNKKIFRIQKRVEILDK